MPNDFDDEIFLAPEATVSLQFESPVNRTQAWDIGSGEALERAERAAWARHAQRTEGLGSDAYDDEDRSLDLREAIRRVLTLSWD